MKDKILDYLLYIFLVLCLEFICVFLPTYQVAYKDGYAWGRVEMCHEIAECRAHEKDNN